MQELQVDPASHSNFTYDSRFLKRKGKVVVGKNLHLQAQLVQLYHSTGLGGHSGIHAIYQRIFAILY